MMRVKVDSTNVATIGFEFNGHARSGIGDSLGTVEVEFMAGSVYQYYNVPVREYRAVVTAHSIGRELAQRIKPNYKYQKVG